MFKRTSLTSGLATFALLCAATVAQAQTYISGSVSGQLAPGVYGQVNIGNAGAPPLLYAQPMWGGPVVQQAQPMYMWVPPDHSRNWRRYCGRYRACGQPVYFLRNPPPHWHAAPPHRHERHWDHGGRDDHRRWSRGDDRDDHRRWDRGDRHDRHETRGRGHDDDRRGHGHGHGRHDD